MTGPKKINIKTVLKALADDTRFSVIMYLANRKSASCKEVCEKFSDLSQPTMSHHFKVLHESGMITIDKVGTERVYSLNIKNLKEIGIDTKKFC